MVIVPEHTKQMNIVLSVIVIWIALLLQPEMTVLYIMGGICIFIGLDIRPRRVSAASVGVMFYWLAFWPWVASKHWKQPPKG